ncbi:MAG: hypothetical protein KatS3mg105_0786 [Gemmatales bacterium]|nr:MAG: hypothetical protein KatS3mg105_0786 [Gemmatales bacterium]
MVRRKMESEKLYRMVAAGMAEKVARWGSMLTLGRLPLRSLPFHLCRRHVSAAWLMGLSMRPAPV